VLDAGAAAGGVGGDPGLFAILDQASLGLPDTVFIEVMMDRHDEQSLRNFEAMVLTIPEVLECHLVTGEYDYVIKAAVGGTAGYERCFGTGSTACRACGTPAPASRCAA
jgi:DNA-binding Lrp family transcriptional regulator